MTTKLKCPKNCCGKSVMTCKCSKKCPDCNCREIQRLYKKSQKCSKKLAKAYHKYNRKSFRKRSKRSRKRSRRSRKRSKRSPARKRSRKRSRRSRKRSRRKYHSHDDDDPEKYQANMEQCRRSLADQDPSITIPDKFVDSKPSYELWAEKLREMEVPERGVRACKTIAEYALQNKTTSIRSDGRNVRRPAVPMSSSAASRITSDIDRLLAGRARRSQESEN